MEIKFVTLASSQAVIITTELFGKKIERTANLFQGNRKLRQD